MGRHANQEGAVMTSIEQLQQQSRRVDRLCATGLSRTAAWAQVQAEAAARPQPDGPAEPAPPRAVTAAGAPAPPPRRIVGRMINGQIWTAKGLLVGDLEVEGPSREEAGWVIAQRQRMHILAGLAPREALDRALAEVPAPYRRAYHGVR
jgi:hypothetical protein